MTNADIALARRFWMHVHEGGTLTTLDVGRMVTAMEEQDAAFTNLHREYDRRGDRIEELEEHLCLTEEKLAKAVEAMEFWKDAVEPDVDKAIALMDATLAELTGGQKDE